jgi:hypothetical protein
MLTRRAVVLASGFGNPMVRGRPCLPARTVGRWLERSKTLEVAELFMGEAKQFYAEIAAEGRVTESAMRHFMVAQEISHDFETYAPMVAEMARDGEDLDRFFDECVEA